MLNHLNKTHLLLVDDDPMLRRYISQYLEKKGFKVICANNYELALTLLEQHPIALCIIDLALPGKSGLELFQDIRKNERTKQLPVIVQSGFGERYLKDVMPLEPVALLQKPFSMDDFLYSIQEGLRVLPNKS